MTVSTSRDGVYFKTSLKHYYVGMRLGVILDYEADDPCNAAASFGQVVRVDRLPGGRLGIAVGIRLR
jgi:hypothetical protein